MQPDRKADGVLEDIWPAVQIAKYIVSSDRSLSMRFGPPLGTAAGTCGRQTDSAKNETPGAVAQPAFLAVD